MPLEHLVANISGRVRREKIDGREYVVTPLSMVVPGVLNGNQGPLLYTIDELSKDPMAWNNMPIVINHPEDEEGNAISARTPEVLDRQGVGSVFNTSVNGKLSALGYWDIEKTRKLDSKLAADIEAGKPIELSTGLQVDKEIIKNKEQAVWNGIPYVGIARNFRPDHLAVLPNKKGACSIKDGCGVNVNEASEQDLEPYKLDWDADAVINQLSHNDLRVQLSKLIRQYYGNNADIVDVFDKEVVYANYAGDSTKLCRIGYTSDLRTGKVELSDKGYTEVVRETSYKPVTNCGSDCACKKCKEEHADDEEEKPQKVPTQNWWTLVTNSAPARGLEMSAEKACQILKDGEVHGNPLTQAQRGMFGAKCGQRKKKGQTHNKEHDMPLSEAQKKTIIDSLITNEGVGAQGPWTEQDRNALNLMPERVLVGMDNQRKLAANSKAEPYVEEDEEEVIRKDKVKSSGRKPSVTKVTKNQSSAGARRSLKEFLQDPSTPPEVRSVVRNAVNFEKKQREQLITTILQNERNEFSEPYLRSPKRKLAELRGIAALAANKAEESEEEANANYAGAGGVPILAVNRANEEDFATQDQDMVPVGMDWDEVE